MWLHTHNPCGPELDGEDNMFKARQSYTIKAHPQNKQKVTLHEVGAFEQHLSLFKI